MLRGTIAKRTTAVWVLAIGMVASSGAYAQTATPPEDTGDIVVTAQKRSESVNSVGISITAASGEQLAERGVLDVSQLAKIVPGFTFNTTNYGAPVYTIRGIGFQESSLSASPAVSVYVDEVPLPFSPETLGASLDLERVEVLKGPQGTFYGQNSTGGAINYIAAKPLDVLSFGVDGRYGRFNTVDLAGFATGPLSDTLRLRVSARTAQSGAWQRSYTRDDDLGVQDQVFGRVLMEWEPTSRFKIAVNANAWRDRSDTQAAQLVGQAPLFPFAANPAFTNYPLAPDDARSADWDAGKSFRQDNRFWQISGRIDYDVTENSRITSISSYSRFDRQLKVDTDGTALTNVQADLGGNISTFFQELRLSGESGSVFHWLLGLNYQHDDIFDVSQVNVSQGSQAFLGATPLNRGDQTATAKAAYANVDYEILSGLTVLGGLRYTDSSHTYVGCTQDNGDGSIAGSGFFPGLLPGQCATVLVSGRYGEVNKRLDQDNVSWRVGLNYKPVHDVLLYATLSKGYKSGSFPLLSLAYEPQANPVTQESVLAYEAGLKAKIARTLQFNAAAFYYDYREKQARGTVVFPIFGSLDTLINVPKSRVLGFELNAVWRPMNGLTVTPSITMVASKVLGVFQGFNPLGQAADLGGSEFPYTPKWSGNSDVAYRWAISNALSANIGANVSYRTGTFGGFGEVPQFRIDGYTLLDLRAGVEGRDGAWRAGLWAQNVTNKYYWVTASRSDGVNRYAGRPATYGINFAVRY